MPLFVFMIRFYRTCTFFIMTWVYCKNECEANERTLRICGRLLIKVFFMFLVQPFLIFGISKIGTQGQIGRLHKKIISTMWMHLQLCYCHTVDKHMILDVVNSFFQQLKYSEPVVFQALTEWNNIVQFANS